LTFVKKRALYGTPDKAKPAVKRGRKATGLKEIAGTRGERCPQNHFLTELLGKGAAMKKRFSILSLVIFIVVLTSIAFAQNLIEIKEKAMQGDARAQFNLGLMYAKGDGVKQDFSQAMLWYEKAAAQGDAQGQNNLGVLYYGGKGVKQDLSQAKLWWEKAAAQGHAAAKAWLQLTSN
jgi:TPR repeat protein